MSWSSAGRGAGREAKPRSSASLSPLREASSVTAVPLRQDALRAKRSQEAAEREWRRKEKEAARRKAEVEQMLKQSRLEQIAQREHSMAVQVQQDRHEFERILR